MTAPRNNSRGSSEPRKKLRRERCLTLVGNPIEGSITLTILLASLPFVAGMFTGGHSPSPGASSSIEMLGGFLALVNAFMKALITPITSE